MTTTVLAGLSDAIQSIDEKTLLLSVSFRRFGQQRTITQYEVGSEADEVKPDKALTSATKRRLDSKALRAIEAFDSQTLKLLAKKTLPALIKTGLYRVGKADLPGVIRWLEQRADGREGLILDFVAQYPADKAATMARLGSLADPDDYPSAEGARAEFGMTWRLLAGGVPAQLAAIDESLDQAERRKYRLHLEQAAESYRHLLRVAAADYVAKLVDQVAGQTKTGGAKRVYASAFENLREFIATFPGRNVADDGALAALLESAEVALTGVGAERVRDDDALRARIGQQFAAMSDALETLVAEAGGRKRKIVLED